MSGLKMAMTSSLHSKLVYSINATGGTTTISAAGTRSKIVGPKLSPSLNSTISEQQRPYMTCTLGGWRITTCVPYALSAHDNKPYLGNKLGFRAHKCFSISIRNSDPSEEDKALGSAPGKVSVSDMGAGNKEDKWRENGHQHPSLFQNQSLISSPVVPNKPQSSKLLTLPTILTLGRVAAVPLFVCTFYMDNWWATTATTTIFIAAAVTDWLDGYIARKMSLGSAFGAFLDPVADKLMVAATLILLCTKPLEVPTFGQVPWMVTAPAIAIIGREITMSAVREWAASQNSNLSEAVAVNNLGKWKTAMQLTALTVLLATRDSSLGGGMLVASGVVLLYISAVLAVWSLIVYMRKIWKVLLK